MPFGLRLRKAASKLNIRWLARTGSDRAPVVIRIFEPVQSRPYETPVGIGASEGAQPPPPVARGRQQHDTPSTPTQVQPEPDHIDQLSTIGPDLDSASRGHDLSSLEEERILEENQQHIGLVNMERSSTNVSTSSSDYSNHSISNSLSPSTPVPFGQNLMNSHPIITPPPTPPDSGNNGCVDPIWGENVKERRHAPLIPQMLFVQRGSSAPDELRTEEILSQLRISDSGHGNDYGQFTPEDSPITGQMHDIPAVTDSETSYSKPITHTVARLQEVEQATNPLHREIHTSTVHTRIQPVVSQGYLAAKHYLETPTGETVGVTDEEAREDGGASGRPMKTATER